MTDQTKTALLSKLRAPVADGWQPIKTAPQDVRVMLGPRHAPVIGIVKHYEDADSDEPAIVCNVVHYNGTVLVAGYRTGEWAPLASAPPAQVPAETMAYLRKVAASNEPGTACIISTNNLRTVLAALDQAAPPAPLAIAPVADELPGDARWPVLRATARNYTTGKHTWDALDAEACEQAAEEIRHLRAALASAPVAGEAQRLDAPAQVGGTRFGKGIHWSTVIMAAQSHYQYMQDPAREAERIAQAKQFQALVAGDAAPQASECECTRKSKAVADSEAEL